MSKQNDQNSAWVWLSAISGVGWVHIDRITKYLNKHEIGWAEFTENPERYLVNLINEKTLESIKRFKKEYTVSNWLDWLNQQQIKYVVMTEKLYPPLLRLIHHPPTVLYYKGDLSPDWWDVTISLVGSRNMTPYGQAVTQQLVAQLTDLGVTTVSGGMYGVDLTVHQNTVEREGRTAVVLGHGFCHTYPSWLIKDHQRLLEMGAVLISQFSPFAHPSKGSFVARNQIVAGISSSLIVVEAAEQSGTHITAQFALDENRDVCAIPGPINSPYSEGTKWLINQGARLITSADEALTSADVTLEIHREPPPSTIDVASEDLLSLFRSGPKNISQLHQQTGKDLSNLMIELTRHELKGNLIKFGQYYRLTNLI